MTDRSHAPAKSDVAVCLVAVAVVALSSVQHPFTISADATTSVALALMALVVGVQRRRRPVLRLLAREPHEREEHSLVSWRSASPWIAVGSVVTAWELFTVASSPRSEYPTLSSLLNAADSSVTGRAIAVALWLLLGAYLVTR